MQAPGPSAPDHSARATRPKPPTVHLICGSTGAGKTRYAIALAELVRGVRFSIEEWMLALYAQDRPRDDALQWASERIGRCETLMWSMADRLIARGIDVVLDLGLSTRDDRDRHRTRAAQTIAVCKLHYLDVGRDVRRARVVGRSAQGESRGTYQITGAMFDAMEALFEPPTDDELYESMIVCAD